MWMRLTVDSCTYQGAIRPHYHSQQSTTHRVMEVGMRMLWGTIMIRMGCLVWCGRCSRLGCAHPSPSPSPSLSFRLPFPLSFLPLNQSQYRSAFVALSHASASITFLLAVHATCLHVNLLVNANMWARRIVSSLWVVRARTVRCHTQRMPTIHAVRC